MDHYYIICPVADKTEANRRLADAEQGPREVDFFPCELLRTSDPNTANPSFFAAAINKDLVRAWQQILSGLPIIYAKGDLTQERWYAIHETSNGVKRKVRDIS